MMRFYRALLALYPASFRNEYRDDLCRAFAQKMRGRSWPAQAMAAIADVVPNAIGAHWERLRKDSSGLLSASSMASDLRFALRQVSRAPLFSGVIVAVIALGIGINAGLLTTLDTVVWKPAPGIPADARLVRLTPMARHATSNRPTSVQLSWADIRDLRNERDVFSDVAGWQAEWVAADFGGGAESVRAWYTTANYFRVLHVEMAAGPGFPNGVDEPAAPIAVIGHSLWMSRFGGAAETIGKTIRVMNTPVTIVGVAPPLFSGVNVSGLGEPSIWLPLSTRALIEPIEGGEWLRRDAMSLWGFARLAPGVHADAVGHLTGGVAARIAREDPASHREFAVRAERMAGMRRGVGDTTETVAAFLIVVVLIVIITCTNVSALLLGRAAARRREIAVRLSLGASRLRIVRQMLTESLVLAAAGATVGVLLYVVTARIAYATIPEVTFVLEPTPMTFVIAAAFALATTIAVGLAPALHASRVGVGEAIKNSGSHAIRRGRLQAAFVVIQLACSQPVLVVTSLVLANLRAAATSSADTPPASVLAMDSELRLPSMSGGAPTRAARDSASRVNRTTYELVRRRLEEVPGVQSVAISMAAGHASFEAPDAGTADAEIRQVHVSPGYFTTMGIPIVLGRAIGVDDNHAGFTGVVVNEETARRMWPGENPIGKRLVRHDREPLAEGFILNGAEGSPSALEVIGVAGSLSYQGNRTTPMLFAPIANAASAWSASIAVRRVGNGDARPLLPAIRAAVREVDPLATINDAATLAEQYAARAREETLSNAAAFTVAAAALLLASLGLYAVIAFAVAQRTREIGIRRAVGATSGDVVRQFFRDGLRMTAIGLAIGIPVTLAGIRVVEASLVGFTLRNATAVLLVVPVLVAIAAVASWLPARRAGRVDPVVSLRSE